MAARRVRKFLPISQYNTNDPLLEAATAPLNLQKLPRHFSRDLQLLRSTAARHQLVSLAANQIRMPHRVFAVLKQSLISVGKWNDYKYQDTDYELVANPEREGETAIKFKAFEECPSVPGMRFAIWNPILQTYHFQQVVLKGSEVDFESSQRTLAGFVARVWDHEARHLDGLLAFSEDISHGQAYVSENFRQNPGMHEMVELIKSEIKLMSKESLKTFFKQSSCKDPVVGSTDQLPEKITNQLRTRLTKQRTKIKDRLGQLAETPKQTD